jgi:hypothetical protein
MPLSREEGVFESGSKGVDVVIAGGIRVRPKMGSIIVRSRRLIIGEPLPYIAVLGWRV